MLPVKGQSVSAMIPGTWTFLLTECLQVGWGKRYVNKTVNRVAVPVFPKIFLFCSYDYLLMEVGNKGLEATGAQDS